LRKYGFNLLSVTSYVSISEGYFIINIRMDLTETAWESVDWGLLAQGRDKWVYEYCKLA